MLAALQCQARNTPHLFRFPFPIVYAFIPHAIEYPTHFTTSHHTNTALIPNSYIPFPPRRTATTINSTTTTVRVPSLSPLQYAVTSTTLHTEIRCLLRMSHTVLYSLHLPHILTTTRTQVPHPSPTTFRTSCLASILP
jgi:hypothetical protein